MKAPDGVVAVHLLPRYYHLKGAIVRLRSLRPVLDTLGLAVLCEVGDHDDGGRAQLPYQPPEVHHCVVCRSCGQEETKLKGNVVY